MSKVQCAFSTRDKAVEFTTIASATRSNNFSHVAQSLKGARSMVVEDSQRGAASPVCSCANPLLFEDETLIR
jgi:hypothetical protein